VGASFFNGRIIGVGFIFENECRFLSSSRHRAEIVCGIMYAVNVIDLCQRTNINLSGQIIVLAALRPK
jgi:hypothetical protein